MVTKAGKRHAYGNGCGIDGVDRRKSLFGSQRRPAAIIFCYIGLGLVVSTVEWNLESFVETGKE